MKDTNEIRKLINSEVYKYIEITPYDRDIIFRNLSTNHGKKIYSMKDSELKSVVKNECEIFFNL